MCYFLSFETLDVLLLNFFFLFCWRRSEEKGGREMRTRREGERKNQWKGGTVDSVLRMTRQRRRNQHPPPRWEGIARQTHQESSFSAPWYITRHTFGSPPSGDPSDSAKYVSASSNIQKKKCLNAQKWSERNALNARKFLESDKPIISDISCVR